MEGGASLKGSVRIPVAKNAALPLLCLSLMTDETLSFESLPRVADIHSMLQLLKEMGVEIRGEADLQCRSLKSHIAPYDWVRKMRASVLVLGPLIGRFGKAEVSLPGGCAIGERPVDIHLKGLEALGAKIRIEGGYIKAEAPRLRGTTFVLGFPTVTGTINLVTAAVFAEGETILGNAAQEPEVMEVCEALNAMGAKITGHGSSQIKIRGVSKLKGLKWSVQPDRIQLLTYLTAAAITGGEVECHPYRHGTLNAVLQKLKEMGCEIYENEKSIRIKSDGNLRPTAIDTAPFPGFPTDAQAQFMACLSVADSTFGVSMIREVVVENRFGNVSELRRMGAHIEVKANTALVTGVSQLGGASVMASDLRASASLVLAGLKAKGKTQVLRVYHLDRGYESFDTKLQTLGAKIWREKV